MRLSRTPHGRITLVYTALVFVIVVAVSGYLIGFVNDSGVTDLEEQLERQAVLVRDLTARLFDGSIDQARIQAASVLAAEFSGSRVTVFGADGTVLADVGNSPDAPVASPSATEVVSALDSGLSVRTRALTSDGQEHTFVAVPIVLNGETVGVVRVSRPTSASNNQVVTIVIVIIITAALVLILSVGLAYVLARRTSRSMEAVAEGARRFAQGDLEYRVDTYPSDDSHDLADAFNQMAATIRDRV
ncbi:MAG: HAMP domain-containing protein, partial [Chloroflexi bacterium]|nr:HAMP domain-containing protein [Chloroflexota bacterium]